MDMCIINAHSIVWVYFNSKLVAPASAILGQLLNAIAHIPIRCVKSTNTKKSSHTSVVFLFLLALAKQIARVAYIPIYIHMLYYYTLCNVYLNSARISHIYIARVARAQRSMLLIKEPAGIDIPTREPQAHTNAVIRKKNKKTLITLYKYIATAQKKCVYRLECRVAIARCLRVYIDNAIACWAPAYRISKCAVCAWRG